MCFVPICNEWYNSCYSCNDGKEAARDIAFVSRHSDLVVDEGEENEIELPIENIQRPASQKWVETRLYPARTRLKLNKVG